MSQIRETNTNSDPIFLLFLAGLLVFRLGIGFSTLMGVLADWIPYLFQLLTFLFTCILIVRERQRLNDFHIDGLVLTFMILFRTLFRFSVIPSAYRLWIDLGFWVIIIGLLGKLLFSKQRSPLNVSRKGWVWVLCGLGIGIGLGYVNISLGEWNFQTNLSNLLTSPSLFGLSIMYQLSNAAIDEEPLFRGLLWGYLRRLGWKEVYICLFQTALFWLAHINFYDRLSFWIGTPLIGMMLGVLAWRSRSIATSMAAHAAFNAWWYFDVWFT